MKWQHIIHIGNLHKIWIHINQQFAKCGRSMHSGPMEHMASNCDSNSDSSRQSSFLHRATTDSYQWDGTIGCLSPLAGKSSYVHDDDKNEEIEDD
eukprot:scaffold26348_cov76-Cyclotella_meneghiniana.AAC.7